MRKTPKGTPNWTPRGTPGGTPIASPRGSGKNLLSALMGSMKKEKVELTKEQKNEAYQKKVAKMVEKFEAEKKKE